MKYQIDLDGKYVLCTKAEHKAWAGSLDEFEKELYFFKLSQTRPIYNKTRFTKLQKRWSYKHLQ